MVESKSIYRRCGRDTVGTELDIAHGCYASLYPQPVVVEIFTEFTTMLRCQAALAVSWKCIEISAGG